MFYYLGARLELQLFLENQNSCSVLRRFVPFFMIRPDTETRAKQCGKWEQTNNNEII